MQSVTWKFDHMNPGHDSHMVQEHVAPTQWYCALPYDTQIFKMADSHLSMMRTLR
jgi:hypothetical protein